MSIHNGISHRHVLSMAAAVGGLALSSGVRGVLAQALKRRHVMKQRHLDGAVLEGVELAYEVRGAGEPVVLVHAGIFAGWFTPLVEEPALTDRYRVLSYYRIGYAGSSRVAGPVSIAQQAAHCRSLMRHLGIERARRRPLLRREHRPAAGPRCRGRSALSCPPGAGAAGGAERGMEPGPRNPL